MVDYFSTDNHVNAPVDAPAYAPAVEAESLEGLLARDGAADVPKRPTVSLVIPAKNEARNITWVLEQIPDNVAEVILVDSSTDATRITARDCRPDIRVVQSGTPGKGSALRTGFLACRGDVIVMMDADGSMSPREIAHYVHFLQNGYDFVKGSRFIGGGGSLDITVTRKLGNRFLLTVFNALYGAHLTDLCYGFCAFHRRYLEHLDLNATGFEIEAEMTVKAMRAGLRIAEVPSLELPRRDGRSNLHAIQDGCRVLNTVVSHHRASSLGGVGRYGRRRHRNHRSPAEQASSSDSPGSSAGLPQGAATARCVSVSDLPVGRATVELSERHSNLVLADQTIIPAKVVTLVRLHGQPVGVVYLDTRRGLSWWVHSEAIWESLGPAVNAHLAGDGLAPVAGLDELTSGPAATTRCSGWREDLLIRPPHITVVVATRDRPESLSGCVEALLGIDYPDYDVVVVDNAPSTDATETLIAERFPTVRYVRESRRGLANAHNRGLRAAVGTIVAFVDDDVTVDRNWLTGIAEGFASASDVGCVTGLILPEQLDTPAQLLLEQHAGFDKGFTVRLFDLGVNRPADRLFPFTAGKLGSGANMAFDSRMLRSIGGFDPAVGIGTFARGGDDLAGFFRIVAGGHTLVYQPSAVVWHRHHREMAAVRNQAFGYGVGLGAYLTSVIVKDPRMIGQLLVRLPRGIEYAFRATSDRNRGRYDALPPHLARLEKRGLMFGPAAYAVSRWQNRGVVPDIGTGSEPSSPFSGSGGHSQ